MRGRGIGGAGVLRGVLRFEPNFGLFPCFLDLYEVGVSPVEGAFGGGLVTNEEAEVLGDAVFVAAERLDEEDLALEGEGAEG